MRIAQIAGDGIGVEVMAAARQVLAELPAARSLEWTELDWSCQRYARDAVMMPAHGLATLAEHYAILLGAVGAPGVPDHVSLWGLLIPIRRQFDQFVNLRPVRVFDGVRGPLREELATGLDLIVVRENTEGEYSRIGGRHGSGTLELAEQTAIFTRRGIARIAHAAAGCAAERSGRLTVATKSNGIVHTMPFWDEVVTEVLADYDLTVRFEHVDALAAKLVTSPGEHDVILGSNLFGDILSDLAAAVCGSLGIAPSANLDPTGEHPSMFEPVHGSAPDIAGLGIANPVGMVWSAAMMLDHLGMARDAALVMSAVENALTDPSTRTADVGGTATTDEVTTALVSAFRSQFTEEHR